MSRTPDRANMEAQATSRLPSRWTDFACVAVFLLIIMAPLAGMLRDGVEREIRESERRKAAPFPEMKLSNHGGFVWPKTRSLKEFPFGFEAWFNDRLWLRREQLRLVNLGRQLGVVSNNFSRPGVGQSARAPVIIGREGWLFYSGDRLIEDYRCTDPFTPDELDHWKKVLEERRDWLAARGIRYMVVFAPNAQTIYGEYLPQSMNRVRDESRLDQLIDHVGGENGVEIIDLRGALIAAKSQMRTYHRTDTHWNEFGAYVGYREILNAIGRWHPAARPHPLSDFTIRTVDAEGDYLAKLVESPLAYREEVIELIPKSPRRATEKVYGESDRITHVADAPLPRVVVLHDSFMVALAPFLSEHFEQAHYLWTRDFRFDVIERERPMLVIEEMVERRLMGDGPRNPESLRMSAPLPRLAGGADKASQ